MTSEQFLLSRLWEGWSPWALSHNGGLLAGSVANPHPPVPRNTLRCPKDVSSDASDGLCPLPTGLDLLGRSVGCSLSPSLELMGLPGAFQKTAIPGAPMGLVTVWWSQWKWPPNTQVSPLLLLLCQESLQSHQGR